MEKFKQKIKKRLIFSGVYCAVILIMIFITVFGELNSLATSFALGFGVGIGAVVVIFMWKYLEALKSAERLKALYIEENDERQKHIDAKIGGVGINMSIMSIAIAMLISNYFDKTVFFTLLAVTLFIVAVKLVLKLYYNKKV